ncbi:MAG: alpha/beta hydrolase [Woeseiaceae bacterium]|nr:alpha/beta hydrolase [Woeseiaceae bacterium]
MHEAMAYEPVSPVRTRMVEIRGIDLNVNEWGDKDAETLLYLHGWGDTGSSFQFVADELGDRWRVIAPDWRGFGRSAWNAASYWFPDYLADLDHLVDALGIAEPIKLIGHSMGANVGGLYAGALPARVSHFINVEGFGLPETNPADSPGRYRDWLLKSRETPAFRTYADFEALAEHLKGRSPLLCEERAEFVARLWARTTGEGIELRMDPNHKLPNPILYRRAEAEACWRAVEAQVLLVIGNKSRFARRLKADQESGGAKRFFPDADTVVVDGAGHMIHFEAPAELASAIDRFMRL